MLYIYVHTHTQWNITQPYKTPNLAICDNVDGSRGYHAKWNKSDRERQILYLTYMWNLKNKTK